MLKFTASPPRIVLQPPRQVVRRGDIVNIDCIATGDQPITIAWAKVDRRPFPPSVIVNGPQLTVSLIHFLNVALELSI